MSRKLALTLTLLAAAALSQRCPASTQDEPIRLQGLGEIYGEAAVRARHGEVWLVLDRNPGNARLRVAQLAVERRDYSGEDSDYDYSTITVRPMQFGQQSGLALRGGGLVAGPVADAAGSRIELKPDMDITLTLGEQRVRLTMPCREGGEDAQTVRCELVARTAGQRQTLATYDGYRMDNAIYFADSDYGGNPGIQFAGDLNRDGRLDLMLDAYSGGSGVLNLYLSGDGKEPFQALGETLVQEVHGC